MNSTYRQSVRPPREPRDWSWERGPHLWTRRSPLQLPPISWGSPQLREGLVQDRLHAQNHTWVNGVSDSDSSFYSISDLDTSIEIDPADGLLDRLELGEVLVPGDLGSRGSQRPSPVIPGTLSRQRSTQLQPRLARRSDWWSPPPFPLYGNLYDRPRYTTAWGTPVSGATRLQVIARVVPDVGDQEADRVGDGTRGVSPPGPPVQEDTGQGHTTRGSARPRSGGPRCLHPISRPGLCPPTSRTRVTCQPRPQPVWEEEDLVIQQMAYWTVWN